MTLKEKAVNGLFWSFTGNFVNQGVQFIVSIILARLLTPKEYGLIGMLAIFIAISQTFIDSGFKNALIRKKNCTQTDYSTVFFFNMTVGLIMYSLLFFSAGYISSFYNEPILKSLIRVLGLNLIISSYTIIQGTTLIKRIDFKLEGRILVLSSVISGIIGIIMALSGYGVWSLVARTLSGAFFSSIFLWIWNKWRPTLVFSFESFKEMFGFGSKLVASQLINTIYQNIYYLVIGKYFSASELGFYTRADMFKNLPSKNIDTIISRVTYPILTQMQEDKIRLKAGYKRMITGSMLISFFLMIGMAATAEPMIISIIGEKWRSSIGYLQMLCFVGMLFPLHSLNLNMLKVQGRSDLFLKLEIIKKILAIPTIIIGILFGIKIMIAGMMFNSLIAYYINSYWSGRLINYPMREQIADITPSFLLAAVIGIIVFISGNIMPFGYLSKFLFQVIIGITLFFVFCETMKIESYKYIKEIISGKIKEFRDVKK